MRSIEVEQHKAVIAEKEAEIQQLNDLQQQQKQQLYQYQQSTLCQDERERDAAAEILDLQSQLIMAEQTKDRAEEELTAAQHQIDKLKETEAEFQKLQLIANKKV